MSDFRTTRDVVAWADARIAELDQPPAWLLDLALARSEEEAISALWAAIHPPPEEPQPSLGVHYDWLYLGFLYLRFEQGQLTMVQLLQEAGEHADCTGAGGGCDPYYSLLNEVEAGGPTQPGKEPFERRIEKLFALPSAEARVREPLLPRA